MDIYDLFSKFELDTLPKEWVQSLWKDDFSEAVEFPTEYEIFLENINIDELISSASAFIKEWLDIADSTANSFQEVNRELPSNSSLNTSHGDKSWQNLIANNVQHKALVAVLSIFILKGKTEKEFDVKKLGLVATDLYLLLLAIPGSQVFHIFNPILYSHAVENLKICSILNKSSVNSKPKGKKRKARNDDDDDFEDEDARNDSEDEEDILPSNRTIVIKKLSEVLNDLLFTFNRFQLKGQDDSILLTIQILILIGRLERSSSSLLSKSPSCNTVTYLSYKAYKILVQLCSSDHGDVEETVYFIMKEMLTSFLIFDPKSLQLNPKEAVVVKDHSVKFVHKIVRFLGDPSFKGIKTLVQHICLKIPDRAEPRAKGVQVVLEILYVLPYSLCSHIIIWLMTFCFNDHVKYRVTGLEILSKLIFGHERVPISPLKPFPKSRGNANNADNDCRNENEVADNDCGNENEEADNDCGNENEEADSSLLLSQQPDFSTNKYLLATVFSLCQDGSSTVRAKALTVLASIISSNNKNIKREVESIFVTPYLNAESIESSNVFEKDIFDILEFLLRIKKGTNLDIDPLPGAQSVIHNIQILISDEKVFVRKSALQVLANIFLMNEKWMKSDLLEIMVYNCRDMSVSVRKQLTQCLTDLLIHYPSHPELPKYWVRGIMQLLADQEIKSQEKVLEALQSVVLDNLVPYSQMRTALHSLPWTILDVIAEQNKRKLFLFACHKWALDNSLKQSLITIIKTHIDTENNIAAWFLLASFSEYLNIKDPTFVMDYFSDNVLYSQKVEEYCCLLVTEVMHLSWRQLPPLTQVNLCDNVLKQLSQFMVPLPMISRCVDMCHLITEAHVDSPEEVRERINEWGGNLISICESKLEKLIGPDSPPTVEDETRLSQYIYTVGEMAQICPGRLSHSVLLLIQNLLIGDDGEEDVNDDEKRWKGKVSASVQAVAVCALGRLCLQKEHTAKVLVPLFGSLLSETPHTQIKINAMIALTDMCIKFTSLVEHHLPDMCICLRDPDLQVRQNTLNLMTQLIQEDYLKLRNPVSFHLLSMLNDEELLIQDTISSFVINCLLVKQSNFLGQHFVEGLFHYNAYTGHAMYSKTYSMGPRERAVFSLEGPDRQKQRRTIYKFMLENMSDGERFNTTYRICLDVLAGVAEEDIELNSNGTTLLQDALYALSSDEIRLVQLRSTSKDDEDEDVNAGEMAQVAQAINSLARKTLISQLVKQNMIDNAVPIFIKLKHKLKKMKSPLVRDLMACLRELMKDYKTEINEILSADKELAAEINHDLQSIEVDEENDSGDENRNIGCVEILKNAVIDVMALNELRKSLRLSAAAPQSPQDVRSTRVSTSSIASQSRDRSPASNKSFRTSPATNRVSPVINGTSPARASPVSNKSSPNSSKSSPGCKDVVQKQQSPETSTKQSPSSSSAKSDASLSPSDNKVKRPLRKQQRLTSTSSNNSEGSVQSQSSTASRRGRRKR